MFLQYMTVYFLLIHSHVDRFIAANTEATSAWKQSPDEYTLYYSFSDICSKLQLCCLFKTGVALVPDLKLEVFLILHLHLFVGRAIIFFTHI